MKICSFHINHFLNSFLIFLISRTHYDIVYLVSFEKDQQRHNLLANQASAFPEESFKNKM